jgi:hypothetical protein
MINVTEHALSFLSCRGANYISVSIYVKIMENIWVVNTEVCGYHDSPAPRRLCSLELLYFMSTCNIWALFCFIRFPGHSLTFKSRQFKYPVLSADRNFLWGFKRLLQWLGKFWIAWRILTLDLWNKSYLLKWSMENTVMYIIVYYKIFWCKIRMNHFPKRQKF